MHSIKEWVNEQIAAMGKRLDKAKWRSLEMKEEKLYLEGT